jgi:predicted anti-sigma-YlaC factor YlaD
MNCADVRRRLPALLYGDLPPGEADEVRQHLGRCDYCRKEHATLAQVRRLLGALPAPAVTVDLPRLYREAAEQQARRLRRWRRVACASLAAAAAVVLAMLLSRAELRLDANQVVLRWGAAAAAPEPPPPPRPEPQVVVVAQSPSTAEIEQELRLLNEAVQTLSNDADSRDERRRHEIDRLKAQVAALQRQLADLRLATEKDVAALYAAQFPEKEKGAQP